MPMALASQPGSLASLARAGPLGGGLGLGQAAPGPVQVGEQVPGLGQPQPVAEALEGGDGQLDIVAALAQELVQVVDGGDAEAADGGVQGQALVADRRRRPGQLLVGPGRLGELAAALLGLGQRRQGGQPDAVVGRQQAPGPARPGPAGVATDGGPLPGGGVALAGWPAPGCGRRPGRACWHSGRPRRSGGRRSRRTGCAGPRSPAPASRRSARAARPAGRRAAARRRRS